MHAATMSSSRPAVCKGRGALMRVCVEYIALRPYCAEDELVRRDIPSSRRKSSSSVRLDVRAGR